MAEGKILTPYNLSNISSHEEMYFLAEIRVLEGTKYSRETE